METFTEPKDLVNNPHYLQQRQTSQAALDIDTIDAPIVDIVKSFQDLPCCFTLQSCYGHFIHTCQQDHKSTERLPISDGVGPVTYRIAYVAFCLDNSPEGRYLLGGLRAIPVADPGYIQFGSAEWFLAKQVNSYILQVEPERFKDKDQATVDYQEQWKEQTGETVPTRPTSDRQPLHESIEKAPPRGEYPGAARNATSINHPGPITLDP